MKLARNGPWFVAASVFAYLGIWAATAASESQQPGRRGGSSLVERSQAPPNEQGKRYPKGKPGTHGPRSVQALSSDEGKHSDARQSGRDASGERRKPRTSAKNPADADRRQQPMAQDLTYRLERDYPGMLQRPARVIPRLDRNHDGQVDPWEREIAQERFDQLDRNRDGIVDPMERATDLVDMDHYGRSGPLQSEPRLVRSQPANTADVPADKPVALKPSRSKSHLKKSVPRVAHPAQASQTPSASPRRQARVTPRHESPAR